ncbi:MAG TPA: cytochrome c, partial [Bryobacteraceae bacterium]|nr:cytochrome c [Bryobacteraceae bacterium]
MRIAICIFVCAVAARAQTTPPGRNTYDMRCAACHGGDGNGGERALGIVTRMSAFTDARLSMLVRQGLPAAGMPGYNLPDNEMRELIAFLRTLRPRRSAPVVRATVQTTDGRTLAGVVLNQSASEMQLRAADDRIHLLRRSGERYRSVT